MDSKSIMRVVTMVYSHYQATCEKGVQTLLLTNQHAVTVELSAYGEKLVTASFIVFDDEDMERKVEFLENLFDSIATTDDAYNTIKKAIKQYNFYFTF